ncbi:putative ATPase [Sphingobium herbicidovorans NBRC 16415]|uniref:ATPase n=1 Tax=Sphingobium herbicidovorans (strain ATCC 700291 / DSM 11019 / CCUG 56400 / KCTC 2939 / LMG 18315 / NBRC 16415 / MH) TaxID=1219045 RepID=A0A086PBL2_SPHHM|nr:hypothetical protein [Sphingobium herbicidovorans]KFG90780.1 putative ATPase [Sphingobium herbicidovorans NBRC 16415]
MAILDEVAAWKLEAADEDSKRYFYHIGEVRDLENGSKSYVIGRKGTGKTAICKYFETTEDYNRFCIKLSFKEFPFNLLYGLEDKDYTRPSQYISLWKYFIYNSILKMMATNAAVDSSTRGRLSAIYPTDSFDYMSSVIQKWTKKSMGLAILGVSGQSATDRQIQKLEDIWQELIPAMEKIITDHVDGSKYYVVFDELDEDYRNYWEEDSRSKYISLVTSLFKAVSNVKRVFSERNIGIHPIVFLRDDIYELLSDPDKNKWEDQKISLNWKREKIKHMLGFRISRSFDEHSDYFNFDIMFPRILQHKTVNLNSNRIVNVFDFIYELTHSRPRDFVRFLRDCAKSSIEQGHKLITSDTVRGIDSEYSNHLRQELINEVSGVIPDINNILSVIGATHNQRFSPDKFIELIENYAKSNDCDNYTKNLGPLYIAKILFHFSIIGNAPRSSGNRPVYKFQREYLTLNNNEPIVVHRGLLRTLGLQ